MMFCSKCGKENLEDANFCAFCGAPLNDFTLGRANVKENTVTPEKKNSELAAQAESCNTIMIVSLVFCCLNYVPYFNFLSCIPAIVLTIIAMNKAISFCSNYAVIDIKATEVEKSVRRVRYHYILSIGAVVIVIAFFIIAAVVAALLDSSGKESYEYLLWPAIFTLFLGVAAFIYNIAVSIVCLVKWISLKPYFENAQKELSQ